MKRIFIITSLLFLTSLMASAQIKIGVKGGLNIATMDLTTEYDVDVSPIASFHVGGFFYVGFNDNFGFQPELMYSGQGAKMKFNISGVDADVKSKLNYLSMPLLLKYNSSVGFMVEAGLAVDFLLSAKAIYDNTDFGQGFQLSDEDIKDNLQGVDLKFVVGLGYALPSGLSFNLRYMGGLDNNIADGENPYFYEDDEATNSVFQLSVGFPLYGN